MTEVDTPTPTPTPAQHEQSGGALHGLEIGAIVGGKYKILSLIGKGGMGSVHRVEHVFLRTEFAMKTMDISQLSDTAVRRFQQEAKAAASLNHPNVVRVHDFGLVDEQQPFYVMDLVEGKSLHLYLQESGMFPIELAKQLFVQICYGLGAAHDQGVVHRDIKPGNIIWCKRRRNPEEGDVKIIDFGIAKVMDSEAHTLTATGQVIGSPSYMSPEQCLGLAVDRRSDIYSLGCMFFEMLTGLPPFIGENALATMMRHQSETAPTLKEATLGKDYPLELEHVVAKMLRKDAATRYQDVHAILADLHAKDPTAIISAARTLADQKPKVAGEVRINAGVFTVLMLMNSVLSAAVVFLCCYAMTPRAAPEAKPFTLMSNSVFVSEAYPLAETTDGKLELVRVKRAVKHDNLPYSEWLPKGSNYECVLHFGPAPSWGKVTINGHERPAMDDINVPPKAIVTFFIRNSNVNETILSKFRGDEFEGLYYEDRAGFTTPILKQVTKFKKLEDLGLWRNNFDDGALQYLAQLPNLVRVDLSFNKITANALIKFPRLLMIQKLQFGPVQNPGSVVRKMNSSKCLNQLVIEGDVNDKSTSLTDADLAALSGNRTIGSLLIINHPLVTVRGLTQLADTNITELTVDDANLPTSDFAQLAKLKKLRLLQVVGPSYTLKDQQKLRELMPWLGLKCTVRSNRSYNDPEHADIREGVLKMTDDPLRPGEKKTDK